MIPNENIVDAETAGSFINSKIEKDDKEKLKMLNFIPLMRYEDQNIGNGSIDFVNFGSFMTATLTDLMQNRTKKVYNGHDKTSALQPENLMFVTELEEIESYYLLMATYLYSFGTVGNTVEFTDLPSYMKEAKKNIDDVKRKAYLAKLRKAYSMREANFEQIHILFALLKYLSLKCTLQYFLFNNNVFFNDLYYPYINGSTDKLKFMFQKLDEQADIKEFTTLEVLSNLAEFPEVEAEIIEMFPTIPEIAEKKGLSIINVIIYLAQQSLRVLYDHNLEIMGEFISNPPPVENLENSDLLNSILLAVIEQFFSKLYYNKIKPVIYRELLNMKLLNDRKLNENLKENPTNTLLFGRYLRGVGFIDYTEKIDTIADYVEYESYEIFSIQSRNLLVI